MKYQNSKLPTNPPVKKMNTNYLNMARHFAAHDGGDPGKVTTCDHYIGCALQRYPMPITRTAAQVARELTTDDKAILFDFGLRQRLAGLRFFSYVTRLNQ